MLALDEIRSEISKIEKTITEMGQSINIDGLAEEYAALEEKMAAPDFWDDNESAQKVLKDMKVLKNKIDKFNAVKNMVEDCMVMSELIEDENDEEEVLQLENDLAELRKKNDAFVLEMLLTGEYDSNNAILSIHPGAGGTESQDWADMLLRMYTRYGEKAGYKVSMLDYLEGDVAGIKSVTLMFEGINAYGYLKAEKGVHRLVRISPFDSAGRRHTSFASVDVMPEVNDVINIEIDPSDLRVDTYRASGAGGQHVNKTESAIRITHIPTGIVVACQNERSQHQNREVAMKMLVSKLTELMEQEHKDKISDLQGDYGQIAWGNQIRSYVFHPYSMVKDHRTGEQTGNVSAVMDGELDAFINAFLRGKLNPDEE
ncbi:MAG: peptide chain release factor 2 [Anaerofustis stercorihominis]|nr:peptide chain release factor 2 [Anaerofustis stercorihominis]